MSNVTLAEGLKIVLIVGGATMLVAPVLMLRYAAQNMGLVSLASYRALGTWRFARICLAYGLMIAAGLAALVGAVNLS